MSLPIRIVPLAAGLALALSMAPGPAASEPPTTPVPASGTKSAGETEAAAPASKTETECSDRQDNDSDMAVDCDDTDCWSSEACEGPQKFPEEEGEGPDQGKWDGPGEDGPGPGKGGWDAPGPGPQGWPEEGPDGPADRPGPRSPKEDGIGVGCQDYMDCVCQMAKATGNKEVAGYNHSATCTAAKSYTGVDSEELCAQELDKMKAALADASETYKAMKIKIPAVCD